MNGQDDALKWLIIFVSAGEVYTDNRFTQNQMNMGIGKGKSDKIYIDGLIESFGNEGKILQVEHSLAENIAELKQTSAALNAAIDRMESIVSKFNSSVQEMQAKKIGAQVHPQTLKSLNNICTNFVVEVGRQLMAHRDNQLELQKEHEKRIARMLEKNEGVWLSNRWLKILTIVMTICYFAVLLCAFCK